MELDDELGLAELGVTAKNANAVEEQIIQEALEETGNGAPDDGAAAGEFTGGPASAAAAANAQDGEQQLQLQQQQRRRERQRVASQLATVAAEIGTMSVALAAAEEEAQEAAAEPKMSGAAPAGATSLQVALMRDRLAGLRAEQQRLAAEAAQLTAGGGVGGGNGGASGESGDGGAGAAAAGRSRPRSFGAAAMARHGAGGKAAGAAAAGKPPAAGGGGTAAAAPRQAGGKQPQQEPMHQQQSKRARTEVTPVTRLTADEDDLFGDDDDDSGAAGATGSAGAGSARLELVETEKDRLIRLGLLTPFDRLAGFERKKVSTQPAGAGGAAGGAKLPFQRTGEGALRHLGRAALSEQEAAAVTRSGRRVGEYLAEAGRQALEAREARPRAKFLEPDQLPQQERDVRKVPAHFWHQAASARKAGASSKLRRKRTLPRARPGRAGGGGGGLRKAAAAGAAAGSGEAEGEESEGSSGQEEEEEDAEGEEQQAVAAERRRGGSRRRHSGGSLAGEEAGPAQEGEEEAEEGGTSRQRRRLRARRSTGGSGGDGDGGGSGGSSNASGGPGAGEDVDDLADSDYTEGSNAPDSDAAEDDDIVNSDDEEEVEEEEDAGLSGLEDEDEDEIAGGAGSSGGARRRKGRKKGKTQKGGKGAAAAAAAAAAGVDEDLYDDVDEQFYIDRVRRAAAAEAEARRAEALAKQKPRRGKQPQQQRRWRRSASAGAGGDAEGDGAAAGSRAGGRGSDGGGGGGGGGSRELEMLPHCGAYGSDEGPAVGSGVGGLGAAEAAEAAEQQHVQQESAAAAAEAAAEEAEESAEAEEADVVFEGGFRVPARLYGRLFDYQRTAVKWLWELHVQGAGGILGDEMGLGKTVQMIAYLAGLHASGLYRPSLIVCPATVLRQWMRELRTWAPALRVVLLHESGRNPPSGLLRPDRAGVLEAALSPCPPGLEPLLGSSSRTSPTPGAPGSGSGSGASVSYPGVVLTTYDQLRLHRDLLLRVRWGVAVLDEGHKIRNPDSEITLVCKQLHTVHRLIMSGSPIQNRLSELWSLFDFIFPGKLGTLPVFQAQFAVPIQVGGYANASSLQVTTAYKCAVVLRDLIAPYLLRRRKADVAAQLPAKTEQVLFCTLVSEQLELYRSYLASKEVGEILEGSRRALCGIDILRKVCNHPDLLERLSAQDAEDYGNPARSGKLRVAERVLDSWRAAGHKALLFCQTQQMLDIFEKLARSKKAPAWSYHRMDGGTPVASRSRLIDDFNNNPDVFLFLLTTKVGGLGVNLTGATRVMLYDPDWNPSTDIQARERAWRIGQSQPVTIYRLITAGTIEEKVYHRQIYKNFLTNKVLRDPRQKRFFTARDISELFTLGPEYKKGAAAAAAGGGGGAGGDTETARIFGSALDAQELAEAVRQQAEGAAGAAGGSGSGGRGAGGGGGAGGAGWLSSTAAAAAALRRRGERPGGEEAAAGGQAGAEEDERGRDGEGGEEGGEGRRGKKRKKGAANGVAAAEQPAAAAAASKPAEEQDESRVLRDLFDGGAGLRGLVDHSRIESANDPELITLHAEAQRVAARAAEALRRSRAACAVAPISTPTWTGRHGHAGAPAGQQQSQQAQPQRRFGNVTNSRMRLGVGSGEAGGAGAGAGAGAGGSGPGGSGSVPGSAQPFSGAVAGVQGLAAGRRMGGAGGGGAGGGGAGGAPSSASLLSQMRSRQQALQGAAAEASSRGVRGSGGGGSGGGSAAAAAVEPAEALAAEVVTFLDSRGGVVGSEVLVEAFRQTVPPAQMPLFKQVLRQVAGLRRRAAGGEWVLKKEFRTAAPEAAAAGGLQEGRQGGGEAGAAAAGAGGSSDGGGAGSGAGGAGDAGGSGAAAGAASGGGGSDAYDFIDLT